MLPLRTRVNLGLMAMKEYSAFPKLPALLKSHHQIICLVSYPVTHWWSLAPLQRCHRCIRQPPPTSRLCKCYYVHFRMNHHHHHHHVGLVARISLTLSRHFSLLLSPQAGLLDYIPYPHIVAECLFVLVVLLLLGHVRGSIRVHHL